MRKGTLATLKTLVIGLLAFTTIVLAFNNAYAVFSLNLTKVLGTGDGFSAPSGVATDGTVLYVADYDKNAILKIKNDLTVDSTYSISVTKPIAIAYAGGLLYVTTESNGGIIFNAGTKTQTGTFGIGNIDPAQNIDKSSDIYVGTDSLIYVADAGTSNIKTYNTADGSYAATIGSAFPVDNSSSSYGNTQFYIPSSLWIDGNGKLLVADYGNATAQYSYTTKYNPFTKQTQTIPYLAGRPKGKVQEFLKSGTYQLQKMYLSHGQSAVEGQVLGLEGICADNTYVYAVDTFNKKVFVYLRAITDTWTITKKFTFSTGASQNVVDPITTTSTPSLATIIANADTGYMEFIGSYQLKGGAYDFTNAFVMLKDATLVGTWPAYTYLVVTDTTGRLFIFSITY